MPEEALVEYAMANYPEEFEGFSFPKFQEPTGTPAPKAEDEPGLFGRFTGSFAEGLQRGVGSIGPGVRAGFWDLVGNEAGFQSAVEDIAQNAAAASKFNVAPSSFAEVRQKYRENGVASAALELADLAVQGTGGSLAYVAPSLGVIGASAIGALSAPAAVLALGGLSAVSMIQFFAEQLNRADEEAAVRGEDLSSEDVNLAGQLAFAMGQTALDRAALLTTGVFGTLAKNSVVSKAANTAAAKSLATFVQNAAPQNPAVRAVASGLSEIVTETGQTAFERAAAGLPIAPPGEDPEEWQRAFDEYVEVAVSALLVGTTMGGAMGAIDSRSGKDSELGVDKDIVDELTAKDLGDLDQAEAELHAADAVGKPKEIDVDAPVDDPAEASRREFEERQMALLDRIRQKNERLASFIEEKIESTTKKTARAKSSAKTSAGRVVNEIRKRGRTQFDVMNLLDEKGIDFESTPEAQASFASFIRRTAGVSNLDNANPASIDKIYRAIESNKSGRLDMPDVTLASSILKKLSSIGKPMTSAKIRAEVASISGDRTVVSGAHRNALDLDARSSSVLSSLVRAKLVIGEKSKSGSYSFRVPKSVARVMSDPEFDVKSDLILGGLVDQDGNIKQAGTRQAKPIMSKSDYKIYSAIHKAIGVDGPVSASETVSEYKLEDKPSMRWVIRDESGAVRRIENSLTSARKFIEGNPDAGLQQPRQERGHVVRESVYSEKGGKKRLIKSVPVHFEPDSSITPDARQKAKDWISNRLNEISGLENPHFLGTQRRGEKARRGRVARLQRLARSDNPESIKEAINLVNERRSPLAEGRVFRGYGVGVDVGSPDLENVWGQGVSDGEFVLRFNLLGKRMSQPVPVVVKSGKVLPNGVGFGAAKLTSNMSDFMNLTGFGNWRNAMRSMIDRMADENAINTGEIVVFPDGVGRIVAVWNRVAGSQAQAAPIKIDAEAEIARLMEDMPRIRDARGEMVPDPAHFESYKKRVAEIRENARIAEMSPDLVDSNLRKVKDPITAIFDMATDSRGRPYYHIVNAFVGKKDMHVEMYGPDQARGLPPIYGRDADPRSIALMHNKNLAKVFGESGEPAAEVDYPTTITKAASRLKPQPERKKNTIWKYIEDTITGWTKDPQFFTKLRKSVVDSGAYLTKAEMKLVSDDYKEAYTDVGTMGAYRLINQSANLNNAALMSGYVKFTKTMVPDRNASSIDGVFTVEKFSDFSNESDLVWVFDPESRKVVQKKFKADLFNEKMGNTSGGLVTVWNSLVKNGQNLTGQLMQYSQAVRAFNMINEGKDPKSIPKEVVDNMREWLTYPSRNPEIAVAYSNQQRINRSYVQILADTGFLTRERADAWLKNDDYSPFMVDISGDEKIFDRLIGGINSIDPTLPYKGWHEVRNGQLADPLQALIGNHTRIVASAINNIARSRAIRDQIALGLARPWKDRLNTGKKITVWEEGVTSDYEIDDPLAFESIQGSVGKDFGQILRSNPVLRWVSTKPSEWLRESVSRSPEFSVANVLRDSVTLAIVNGLNFKTLGRIYGRAFKNFKRAASGAEMSASFRDLERQAVITGWGHVGFHGAVKDIAGDVKKSFEMKQEGKTRRIHQRVWDALGRFSAASEAAAREIVFEDSFKRHLDEFIANPDYTHDQASSLALAQAAHDAREVLNFSRHGDNQYLNALLQTTPFMNAKIQGLDILGGAFFKYRPVGYRRLSLEQTQKVALQRGMVMAAASTAIAMLNYGDEDYENEDGFVRDMNWLLPVPGTRNHIAIPIPHELGLIFKTIPEQIARAVIGAAEGELGPAGRDMARASRHAIVNTMGLSGFIPVVLRPPIEAFANKSIFTNRRIVPFYEENLPATEQYGPYTTAQARLLSHASLGAVSPRFIDNEIRTIAGGLGVYAWSISDHVLRLALPGMPTNPAPRMTEIMGFRRFLRDEFGSGVENEFYEFKSQIDASAAILRKASPSRRAEIRERLAADIAIKPQLNAIASRMEKIRAQMRLVKEGDLSPLEKSRRRDELERIQKKIMESYRNVRARHDAMQQ